MIVKNAGAIQVLKELLVSVQSLLSNVSRTKILQSAVEEEAAPVISANAIPVINFHIVKNAQAVHLHAQLMCKFPPNVGAFQNYSLILLWPTAYRHTIKRLSSWTGSSLRFKPTMGCHNGTANTVIVSQVF